MYLIFTPLSMSTEYKFYLGYMAPGAMDTRSRNMKKKIEDDFEKMLFLIIVF